VTKSKKEEAAEEDAALATT